MQTPANSISGLSKIHKPNYDINVNNFCNNESGKQLEYCPCTKITNNDLDTK